MSERESGYYWIKYEGGFGWELAEYAFGAWYLIGSDVRFDEDEGPRRGFGIRIIDAVRIYPPTS